MPLRDNPEPNVEKLMVLRYLRGDFFKLIYDLNELSSDVASLEIINDLKAVANLQRSLMIHIEKVKEFKKKVDETRMEIENDRLAQKIRAQNKKKKKKS